MSPRRARFDLVEVCLIGVLAGAVGWFAHRPPREPSPPEAAVLEARYGPERHSENMEEWIIRDFFQDRRGGFFVDVGAGPYRENSNTYYLEHELGWSGLAIEPLRHFEAGYLAHRPRTRFLPFFVSDVSDQEVTMYTYEENFLASSTDKPFVERFGKDPKQVQALTITLTDLFEREKVGTIDFMSMDIELAEPKALAGLDIDRFRPVLVCIEAHPEVRQQILDYFSRHHYVLIGAYLRIDEKNLYFTPL